MLWLRIMISDKILKKVSKPGRYIGGEYGQILKDKKDMMHKRVDHKHDDLNHDVL